MPDDLLTAAQVAELLDVPLRTIQWRAANGVIPVAQKLPGRTGALLFRRADIAALAGEAAS